MVRELLKTLAQMWQHTGGRSAILGLAGVVGAGTVFYRFVEDWSWVDSLYFTVVTLTTVGYGDLHPTTALSKLFTVALILVGVGAILAFLDFVVKQTARRQRLERKAD
jgi:hypothetical protein